VEYNAAADESLLSISLKTGLRHQIRARLAYLCYPIIGDELYGGVASERLFLHAESYKLKLETGEKVFFCPCPFS